MNYTTAVLLINANIRAVLTVYEDDEEGKRSVTKTMFKTLDKNLTVGDYVTVPSGTRHKMTVVKVTEVDVDVDFDSTTQVGWIIGKVDKADYAEITSQENIAVQAIKSAEKLKKRNELRDALLADNADKLKALPIASMGNPLSIDKE